MMALVIAPLSFLIIGYGLIFVLSYPTLRPLFSIYSLITSEYGPDFNTGNTDLYQGGKGAADGTIALKDVKIPSYGDQYGVISIDRINLNVKLYYGDSNDILDVGAGQFSGSYLPGFNRTIMIAGHTIPYFQRFGELVVGDTVQISTHYGNYSYQITEIKVGKYDDSSMYNLAQREKEQLILYTCYPLDGIGFKQERLFVYADKISGPIIQGEAS